MEIKVLQLFFKSEGNAIVSLGHKRFLVLRVVLSYCDCSLLCKILKKKNLGSIKRAYIKIEPSFVKIKNEVNEQQQSKLELLYSLSQAFFAISILAYMFFNMSFACLKILFWCFQDFACMFCCTLDS